MGNFFDSIVTFTGTAFLIAAFQGAGVAHADALAAAKPFSASCHNNLVWFDYDPSKSGLGTLGFQTHEGSLLSVTPTSIATYSDDGNVYKPLSLDAEFDRVKQCKSSITDDGVTITQTFNCVGYPKICNLKCSNSTNLNATFTYVRGGQQSDEALGQNVEFSVQIDYNGGGGLPFDLKSDQCTVFRFKKDYVCGAHGNVSQRIQNCNFSVVSTQGVPWKLVSRVGHAPNYYEVWMDMKTGLVWGDKLPSKYDGEAADDHGGYWWGACTTDESKIANAGLTDKTFGIPQQKEWVQAEVDGIREVLPNFFGNWFWSGTRGGGIGVSSDRNHFGMNGDEGPGGHPLCTGNANDPLHCSDFWFSASNSTPESVRCVGR